MDHEPARSFTAVLVFCFGLFFFFLKLCESLLLYAVVTLK